MGRCGHPATRRIGSIPHRIWACSEGIQEYNEIWGRRTTTPKAKPSAVTEDEIRELKLTKQERKDLADMPEDEQRAVVLRLLRSQRRQRGTAA